ncbi:MAG: VCBS repeat-containing protein [Alphaproteobacteria bacterium]|nr:VCBS repeat-containing protein [Alphaproteobacteria bacterium]
MTNSQNITVSGMATLGVALGDLDGDGDLDAFLANRYVGSMVFKNDGTGTFTDTGQVLGTTTHEHLDVSLADLDGDGDLDAVVSNYNTYDQFWINNGTGTFTEAGLNIGSGIGGANVIADFNGDGKLDVALAQIVNAASGVYLNTTTVFNATMAQGATFTFSSSHLNASDVDGDTLTYTVTSIPANGSLKLNGTALSANGTFTQADVNAGNVTYTHSGTFTDNDGFTFTVTDGTTTLAAKTFNLGVFLTTGDANNNTLKNSTANSAFDGGAGTDTLDIGAAMANHTLGLATNGTVTITDTVGGDVDTAVNIETLKFSDGTVTVATQAPQQMINTTTTTVGSDVGLPSSPGITMLDDGGYVVYWSITRTTGGDKDMLAQRYDMLGQKVGAEFQLNDAGSANTALDQDNFAPHFASLHGGGFAAVWSSVDQSGAGTGHDVVLRIYDSAGTPGSEILVNTTTANGQHYPEVAQIGNGDLLVVWQTYETDNAHFDITAQRLDSSGNKIGSEFTVNQTGINSGTASSRNPDITALKSGGFAVVWDDDAIDGSGNATMLRIYDSNGAGGGQIQVNVTTTSWQEYPHVAELENGNIAVVWQGTVSGGSGYDVAVRVFNSSGTAVSGEVMVNATTTGDQGAPQVAALEDGGFVVVWHSNHSGNNDVYAQRFDASGVKVGSETLVNDASATEQSSASVTGTYDGGFIVTWYSGTTQDITTKRFDANGNTVGYTKLTGDAGNNTFKLAAAQKGLDIDGAGGTDSVTLNGTSSDQNLVRITNVETVTGSAGKDMVAVGNTVNNTLTIDLGAGHDTVKLADGGNTNTFPNVEEVIGGTGNDNVTLATAFVAGDKAFMEGGAGTDTLNMAAGGNTMEVEGFETINGGSGTDTIAFARGGDLSTSTLNSIEAISLDADNNDSAGLKLSDSTVFNSALTITGTGGNDSLHSDGGMNLTNVTLSGISTINLDSDSNSASVLTVGSSTLSSGMTVNGTGGNDTIQMGTGATSLNLTGVTLNTIASVNGTTGNDTMVGAANATTLAGGLGADSLTGGVGATTFRYNATNEGGDTISGFTAGTDTLAFNSAAFSSTDGVGALNVSDFTSGAGVTGGSYFAFDTSTNTLYYDADAAGGGAGVAVATVDTTIGSTDINIV